MKAEESLHLLELRRCLCLSWLAQFLLQRHCRSPSWNLYSDSVAGVESPSHAIRADADPLARSATSVVITLADKYTYDCPVRILIYPSGRSVSSLQCPV